MKQPVDAYDNLVHIAFHQQIREQILPDQLGEQPHKGLMKAVGVIPEAGRWTLKKGFELIRGRKTEKKEGSYTTYLFEKGMDKILKKVGEECTEVIIAGAKKDKEETIFEIADLTYHLLVMMVEAGISLQQVIDELAKRHVVDHKVKQERMQ